jgi:CRP-like cAMP-binding protein
MVSRWWTVKHSTPEAGAVRRNRLLRALPAAEAELAEGLLQGVELRAGETLQEPGETLRYVYFPADALLSTTIVMRDGAAVEYGTIGCDGVFGNRFMARWPLPGRTLCQVGGYAFRMRAKDFSDRTVALPVLRELVNRYGQYLYATTAQLVACNTLHPVIQRCARWLLVARICLGRHEFDLTQEFLAMLLGVRRASITGAIGKLQRSGYVKYRRGCVTIVRPKGLERAACECYRVSESRKMFSAPFYA